MQAAVLVAYWLLLLSNDLHKEPCSPQTSPSQSSKRLKLNNCTKVRSVTLHSSLLIVHRLPVSIGDFVPIISVLDRTIT